MQRLKRVDNTSAADKLVQLNGKVASGAAKGAHGAAKPQTNKWQGRTTANAALLKAAKPPTHMRQYR
jgi:hypothetical protein